MRKLKLIALSLALSAPLAQAAGIAVVNSQQALSESSAARAYEQKAEAKFKDKIAELQKVDAEVNALETKLERDKPTMSKAELAKQQVVLGRKKEDLQLLYRSFQVEKNQDAQRELSRLGPILEQAVNDVAKKQDLDLVLEYGAARYVKPGSDITKKVIEQMNKLTTAKK